ncbi:PD-(D/E)XK nuclease family protein [Arthrobacter sp. MSA 4-2]|uniref:PD-(D/E)XK nuclease family protein n=1 Tax=Arthrobacter sp. MSA 4-2 TaxID=2794349 RepID=UPI0018E792F2|nr:PD-(D/E)XK nuclease family protein [Arthrobacter sp. MSA 4-2]MBJ2119417.1 PD-(D/E)XK nuclease family protein [Arthrobacter sp. MSA 4-2]
MMQVEFGWFLDRAPWAFNNPGLNAVRVGPLGFTGLLQTRLGITRPEVSHTDRVNQYTARLQELDQADAWFHHSFSVDPWSTAHELLDARDDLIANGWDGQLPAGATSELLRTLSALEHIGLPLSPALADDIADLVSALDSPLALGISTILLQHPRESFPEIWQRILDRLEARGTLVLEPGVAADAWPRITVLQAETEWEAAEHSAGWLASNSPNNAGLLPSTAVVTSHPTSVLDHYLGTHDLPRLGVGAKSRWRAQDQIIPLFMEVIWGPVNVQLLGEFLSLPVGPVRGRAARELLGALKAEPGTGGPAWKQALENIAADLERGPAIAAELDSLFSSALLLEESGVTGAQLAAKAAWLARRLGALAAHDEELKSTAAQLQTLLSLISGLPAVSRTDLRRIISSVMAESSSPLAPAEASPWLRLNHLSELMDDVDDVLWWGFQSASSPRARRWDAQDMAALAAVGVQLPTPESMAALQVSQTLAASQRCRNLLIVTTAQLDGERLEGNPLLEALVAAQPAKAGPSGTAELLRARVAAVTVSTDETIQDSRWHLACRSAALVPVPRRPITAPPASFGVGRRPDFLPVSLSFSQLGNLLGCSLAWVLDKKAKIRPADAESAPSGNKMIGTFVHKLVEELQHDLSSAHRAVPTPEEIEAKLEALLPHFASEFLLPGNSARLKNIRTIVLDSVMKFFSTLSAAGISIESVEHPFEKDLDLMVGGEPVTLPVKGSVDVVGIDDAGRPVVIDLKWSNRDKYRVSEVREGKALQLALYQWSLQEEGAQAAPAAYYLLKQGTFASTNPAFGNQLISEQDPETLWNKAVKAAEFSVEEVLNGRVTADPLVEAGRVAEGGPSGEELAAAAGRFYAKPPCTFCNFSRLCGLKGDFS